MNSDDNCQLTQQSSFAAWLLRYWDYIDTPADFLNFVVDKVTTDSREIDSNCVFIAAKGFQQDGCLYVKDALAKGAVAVLMGSEDKAKLALDWPQMPSNVYGMKALHELLPSVLADFYQGVSQLQLVGVTGTNGKTTVSQLVAQLAVLSQHQAGVIGTLGAGVMGNKGELEHVIKTANTTPSLAKNFELLNQFALTGCDIVTMEVSSAGLDQARVNGLGFDCVIMTNLTQDHLDYHGDMASYANAKRQLFENNPDAAMVLNVDDSTALAWYQDYRSENGTWAIGRYEADHGFEHYLLYKDLVCTAQGFDFVLVSHLGEFKVEMPLYGEFNVYNLLCALAACVCKGIDLALLVTKVPLLKAVSGRMEQFKVGGKVAIVDYAHTPDALAQALKSLHSHCKGKLWCVFGCGGDRDKTKRPLMAQAAQQYADCIVITNDNPRHENPECIAADIQQGLENSSELNVQVQLDRKLAIADTLALANDDDIVLIAGKGHETYQVFGDDVIEYDERAFVHQCCVSLAGLPDQLR